MNFAYQRVILSFSALAVRGQGPESDRASLLFLESSTTPINILAVIECSWRPAMAGFTATLCGSPFAPRSMSHKK